MLRSLTLELSGGAAVRLDDWLESSLQVMRAASCDGFACLVLEDHHPWQSPSVRDKATKRWHELIEVNLLHRRLRLRCNGYYKQDGSTAVLILPVQGER